MSETQSDGPFHPDPPATGATTPPFAFSLPRVRRPLSTHPAVRLILIAGLALLLLIPMAMVSSLIGERQARHAGVLADFRASWGAEQTLAGPILVVPYLAERQKDDKLVVERRYLHIAPDRVSTSVRLTPEIRARGLFQAVLYGAELRIEGRFTPPEELPPARQILWSETVLALRASDMRALGADSALEWDGRRLAWTGCGGLSTIPCGAAPFVMARGVLAGPPAETIAFSTRLELRGIEAFWMEPLGRDVALSVASTWPNPSFGGAVLPSVRSVTGDGFQASWRMGSPAGASQAAWTDATPFGAATGAGGESVASRRVGVELLEAVPTYRMVERSSKYDLLFLGFAFLTYFLLETIAGVRIHIVQYALMGLSISLFALLLISLSEPLGFGLGYLFSAVLVLAQASLYTLATTRRWRPAAAFAGVIATLLGFVYVLLSLESYALLTGALALFAGLSAVMAVTRHVDWSRGEPEPQAARPT